MPCADNKVAAVAPATGAIAASTTDVARILASVAVRHSRATAVARWRQAGAWLTAKIAPSASQPAMLIVIALSESQRPLCPVGLQGKVP